MPRRYRPRSWVSPKIEVRPSPIEGVGLFARNAIAESEWCVVFGGRLITADEFRRHVETSEWWSAVDVAPDAVVLQPIGDEAGYLNHSCDPNTWMEDEVTVAARRPISADEELTLDYALITDEQGWELPCHCGARTCRGTVTGDDWRRPALQRRYRGHFSPFIERRINGGRSPKSRAGRTRSAWSGPA